MTAKLIQMLCSTSSILENTKDTAKVVVVRCGNPKIYPKSSPISISAEIANSLILLGATALKSDVPLIAINM